MKRRLGVMDSETDPFEHGQAIEPFVVGFYDGYDFMYFWGDDCRERYVAYMEAQTRKYLIYAHNGGKFDMMFFLKYLEDDLHIQNGRIVRCYIGQHEFRDSYSIIPVALAKFKGKHQKKDWTEADYQEKMCKANREKYKAEILDYLQADCLTLYDGVVEFQEEFGTKLTIGSTSMANLQEHHGFSKGSQFYDEFFRPYYFGGRNQCFASGIIEGDYEIYDVNSMYPYVMKAYDHPISTAYNLNNRITSRTTFALIEAKNEGCLPMRTKTGLDFTVPSGRFYASIHEIRAGEETGTLKIQKVLHSIEHKEVSTFGAFVDHFYAKRLSAKALGRDMRVTFYKLILNSAYGKFAQNPENFKEYNITHDSIIAGCCQPSCPFDCQDHWRLSSTNGDYFIWERPSSRKLYFNVATAASITAAARAVLLRGLAAATSPIYCDTDSIIAKKLGVNISTTELGGWKPEGKGNRIAIAGKKLYAVFDGQKCIKQANKGAVVTAAQIVQLAQGAKIGTKNPVPHFKFDGRQSFVSRTLRATAVAKPFRIRS